MPRLEQYDFENRTPTDLARLRQMAPAETDEGPLARYALARAHADWLVLALIRDRQEDQLLRLLAVDLGIEGTSPDDRLTLQQTHAAIDAILVEVRAGAAAGGEARQWARAIEGLLEAIREGWEEFSPELIRAVAEAAEEEGPGRVVADLLAVGWGRLALFASQHRPPSERAEFLARMTGYGQPDLVDTLAEEGANLLDAGVELSCPQMAGAARGLQPHELLGRVRASCDGSGFGLPDEADELLSVDLVTIARILQDLRRRRQRLSGATTDPLLLAAAADLEAFDTLLPTLRFPLPLPAPGPNLPRPAMVDGPGEWRPSGAVVTLVDGRARIGLWPTLAMQDGEFRFQDQVDGLGLPGRPAPDDLAVALTPTWQVARRRLGLRERSVTILATSGVESEQLLELIESCQQAGASRVDLAVLASPGHPVSVPVSVEGGAAVGRTPNDRRALLVLGAEAVQVSTIEGGWVEIQDLEGELALERIAPVLAEHIAGPGNPECIVAVRPDCDLGRVASLADLLRRTPRSTDGSATGWRVTLDPEEPPAPAPVARSAADAVAQHRIRLRSCYERYLRAGGTEQGLVMLEISVAPDGEVSNARVAESELGPQANLDACLVGEALRIRFPASIDTPRIRVPLRFVPQ